MGREFVKLVDLLVLLSRGWSSGNARPTVIKTRFGFSSQQSLLIDNPFLIENEPD
jgi:hypothetical protein